MSIASASTTVKFHEFPSGTVVHNYQPGTQIDGPIRSISWSKNGHWLALVPHSGPAEILSIKDEHNLTQYTIEGIEEPSCAAFQHTTKKNIAVGTKGGQVLIYDIKSRSVKKRFPRATSEVTHVQFTSNDSHVVAACGSGETFLYSNITNNLSGTFKIPRSQSVSDLRTNPIKKNYVVAGSNEGVVVVWDINANKNKFFVGSHKAPVTAVAFSPVNSELVVSTGLDRQFCFYDIGDGNKCVASIFVENSMTSVDFSPDGKFIAMASQKGNIYIYDSKNFQQPIHSFFAHSSAVKHLLFRKTEDFEGSFDTSMFEGIKEKMISASECRTNESIGATVLATGDADNDMQDSNISVDAGDSFSAAMCLDRTNTTAESIMPEGSLKSTDLSKRILPHKQTPTNLSKMFQKLQASDSKSQITSTPNLLNCGIVPGISPIVGSVSEAPLSQAKTKSIENLVKNTVQQELQAVTEDLKNDIKYHSTHILSQTRQMFLDLLMSMVKESIKMENNFNCLRAELVCDMPQNQGILLEENLMLKQRIARLEEELSLIKTNNHNTNTFM